MRTAAKRGGERKRKRRHGGPPPSPALSRPNLPYTMRLPDGRTVCVEVPGRWVMADRDGTPAFLPDGVRFLDRVRALFSTLDRPPSPGYITSLREALGMTQEDMGEKLGVAAMTVSRWERGTVRPSAESLRGIERLRREAVRKGVALPS